MHQMYPVHSSPLHSQRMSVGNGGGGVGMGVQRQQSMTNLRETRSPNVVPKASSAPTHPDDVMAPQSICFIGDQDDIDEIERNVIEKMQSTGLSEYSFPIHHHSQQQQQQQQYQQSNISHMQRDDRDNNYDDYVVGGNDMMPQKLNITSGNLTYRIPSPQRPQLHPNSFQVYIPLLWLQHFKFLINFLNYRIPDHRKKIPAKKDFTFPLMMISLKDLNHPCEQNVHRKKKKVWIVLTTNYRTIPTQRTTLR